MRYSALITLNFARRDEMPGCGLQLLNFIRYCPSGRARGSFCGWVFCVWVSFQSGHHARVRVCDLLLYAGKRTQTTQTRLRRQSFGLAPGLSHFVPRARRCDQSLSLPLVASCYRSRFVVAKREYSSKQLQSGCGSRSEQREDSDELPCLRGLRFFSK